MAKSKHSYASMRKSEALWGWVYALFYLLLLPSLLESLLPLLHVNLAADSGKAILNFCYYTVNFLACLLIFHGYLLQSLRTVGKQFWSFFQAVILGFVFCWVGSELVLRLTNLLYPSLINQNSANILAMAKARPLLMLLGTVALAPLAEECTFRGLIFHRLYRKNKALAYSLSMAAFSAVHLLGSVGREPLPALVLLFLQYLPAGAALAWSYAKSGTVFTSIFVHACFNAWSYLSLLNP